MLRLLATLMIATTYAYQQDLAKLPNGNKYGITLGHPGGATKKATPFALSFYSAGQKWGKAFCQADSDGDGQSNGLEMGDPCCIWAAGKTPMIATDLSDPNSAASKTVRQMPTCVQATSYAFEKAMLQCAVCTQALQLEMNKPSDNAADFILLSVKSCKASTQDDQQKLVCIKTMVKNADQLFNDQKNGVSPTQSCMNLGLTCTQPPVPITNAPVPTTNAPAPTTQAPAPTTNAPVPPLPPVIKYEMTKTATQVAPPPAEEDFFKPVVIPVISTVIAVSVLWGISHLCKKNHKEPLIEVDDSVSPLPDIEYREIH